MLAIAAPSLHAGAGRDVIGYGALLAAAAAWAVSIVAVRAHRFAATTLVLAPWQMLLAGCLLLPAAALIEGRPRLPGAAGAASLAYVGPVATAFAYWAVVEAGRRVSASTLSMALLATPGFGILASALLLGEKVGLSLIAGVVLTGIGIRLASGDPGDDDEKDRFHAR